MASVETKIVIPERINIRQPLPRGWLEVAGILRKRRINPMDYQKRIRKEWGKRLKKFSRAASL